MSSSLSSFSCISAALAILLSGGTGLEEGGIAIILAGTRLTLVAFPRTFFCFFELDVVVVVVVLFFVGVLSFVVDAVVFLLLDLEGAVDEPFAPVACFDWAAVCFFALLPIVCWCCFPSMDGLLDVACFLHAKTKNENEV